MDEKVPFTYLQGNLTDAVLVNEAVRGKDVIINLAWSFADDPQTVFGEDIKGHVNLLEAVRQTPSVKAVVNVTTDKCYENRGWNQPYQESEELGGYDPYSSSKGCSEPEEASEKMRKGIDIERMVC
jgi:nucleoside-diphosphate-sugar epimerase